MVAEGTLVGKRYRILTQIGKGGMSTVYLAMDSSLNKQWAVKEIRNVTDPVQRDLVIRSLTVEANMIKRFDHPAIPRIVDLIEEKSSLFVVMDYVEGQTLSALLKKKGAQKEEDVVDWGIQLCDVLDYLHRRKPPVVFRDVKPSNIMLTPDGAIKLIDFGIALEIGKGAVDKPLIGDDRQLGTPGYGAPEQFDEHGVVDARTDIYALGASLFHLLTGSHPRKNGIVPIRQIRPELSEGLEQVIEKATRQNPDDRFQTCAEFAYALKHYREEDAAHHAALVARWRGFLGTSIAAVVCLALSGGSLLLANHAQNTDYDYWMNQAAQTTDDRAAEDAYVRAAEIMPDSIEPYEDLIERYTADGDFSDDEEQVYNTTITQNSEALRANADDWATLSYDTGRMYWYYYSGDKMQSEAGLTSEGADPQRYARIRAASQWMHNAAEDEDFENVNLAKIYSAIADFNTQIVPMINEGSDSGQYEPYFTLLQELVANAADENSEVIRLEAANLTLDALRIYPRKFRMDGIRQSDMADLAGQAADLAETTETSTDALDDSKQEALAAIQPAEDAISNAFVDIKGDAQ